MGMRGALQLSRRSRERIGAMNIRGGLVALFVAALVVNLLQLDLIPSGGRFKPLPRHQTADITKIAEKKSPGLKAGYSLFFELGRRYPGSTIILPRSAKLEDVFAA